MIVKYHFIEDFFLNIENVKLTLLFNSFCGLNLTPDIQKLKAYMMRCSETK